MTSSHSPHPSVFIKIADLTIALTSEDPALTLPNEGAIAQFLVSDATPDVRVRAAWGELGEVSGEKLFDSGGLWQLYAAKDSRRFHFTTSILGPIPYKMASFDPEFTTGEVLLHRPYFPNGQTVYPLEYPLDELLILHLLAKGRGVEVHACGVVDPAGQGYLFAGQSDAGKTTIARLWQKVEGMTVLSDDRIILRNIEGRLWMYGTPWHGEGSCPVQPEPRWRVCTCCAMGQPVSWSLSGTPKPSPASWRAAFPRSTAQAGWTSCWPFLTRW